MSLDLAGGIVGEIKRHPYTSIAALLCLGGMPFLYTIKADAGDVKALTGQITELRETVRRESMLAELSDVRRELFDISLRISTLEREKTAVDTLLYRRREDLLAQQRSLESRLQVLDAKE